MCSSDLNYVITYISGTLLVIPVQGDQQNSLEAYFSSPTSLQVNVYALSTEAAVIQVFDIAGHPLLTAPVALTQGFNPYSLPLTNAPAGVYIVRVTGNSLQLTKKIAKL